MSTIRRNSYVSGFLQKQSTKLMKAYMYSLAVLSIADMVSD
eukprot:CAMPEP_0182483544 /NCGR_PEP_ID=MMETSP1319-20130603/41533_1 /TAXON_ID=172717 /ORGANISM="Bolidomonas pacifica, Strain RCC208" /LENGTH=40 /DNA_ID= /DNA_START= /DNA_END= /DNA_ORIENTATION=